MAKKITLETLAAQMAKGFATQGKEIRDLTESVAFVVKHMATKDDIADVRRELKGDIVRVSEQVASIETQLRDMKHTKLHARVADLEEKVFGAARA
jgi:hypothetical protein